MTAWFKTGAVALEERGDITASVSKIWWSNETRERGESSKRSFYLGTWKNDGVSLRGEQGAEASWLGCRTVVWLTVPNGSRCRCNEKLEGQQSLPVWNLECGSGLQERCFQQETSALGQSGLNEVPSTQHLRRCLSEFANFARPWMQAPH